MRQLNEVYFAKDGGITETSAAHLCAVAAQVKTKCEEFTNSVNFINTTVISIISQNHPIPTKKGMDINQLLSLKDNLKILSELNAFIAWFAEARKEIESYKKEYLSMNIRDYCEMKGIEYPEEPEQEHDYTPIPRLEDMIAEMDIKERQVYLALEAKAAVYGKFIHPGEPMDRARKSAHTVTNNPNRTEGSGQDMVIYQSTTSVAPEEIDNLYNQLQVEYRETEQKLNSIKSDLQKRLTAKKLELESKKRQKNIQYQDVYNEYRKKYDAISSEFTDFLTKETERLSKIRFAIPDSLKSTYEYLNTLGK